VKYSKRAPRKVSFQIAADVESLIVISRRLRRIAERECSEWCSEWRSKWRSKLTIARDAAAEKRLMAEARQIARRYNFYTIEQASDPRAGGGLKIFWSQHTKQFGTGYTV